MDEASTAGEMFMKETFNLLAEYNFSYSQSTRASPATEQANVPINHGLYEIVKSLSNYV